MRSDDEIDYSQGDNFQGHDREGIDDRRRNCGDERGSGGEAQRSADDPRTWPP